MFFTSLQERSDEELMKLLQAGCQDALGVLFDRYYRLVFRTASGILRDRAEAQDVMQDVFLEIYRDAAKFDPARGKFRTWLLQYAYHRSLNRRKYLSTRGFYEAPEIHDRIVEMPDAMQRNGLTIRDWSSSIQTAMRQLKPKEREAIELVCYEGLLLREIAESLRDTLPNVRNHYYRGLKKLRRVLDLPQPPVSARHAAPAA